MYHKGILKDLAIKLIRNSKEKITKINNIKKWLYLCLNTCLLEQKILFFNEIIFLWLNYFYFIKKVIGIR